MAGVNVRIDEELIEDIDTFAQRQGVNRQRAVNMLIRRAVAGEAIDEGEEGLRMAIRDELKRFFQRASR